MRTSCLIYIFPSKTPKTLEWTFFLLVKEENGPGIKNLSIPENETSKLEDIFRAIESRWCVKMLSIDGRKSEMQGSLLCSYFKATIDIPEEFLLTSEFEEAREHVLKHLTTT